MKLSKAIARYRDQLETGPRLGIVLGAGLLTGLVAALVAVLFASNPLIVAVVAGFLAAAIVSPAIAPGDDFKGRCMIALGLGGIECALGIILLWMHTAESLGLWMMLPGLLIFVVSLILSFGGDRY